jgi:hypothetical protein
MREKNRIPDKKVGSPRDVAAGSPLSRTPSLHDVGDYSKRPTKPSKSSPAVAKSFCDAPREEAVEKALCCVPPVRSLSGGTRPEAFAAAVGCALEEGVEKGLCCVPPGRSLSGGPRPEAFAAAVGCALEGGVEKGLCCVPPGRSLSGGTSREATAGAVGRALDGRITLQTWRFQRPPGGTHHSGVRDFAIAVEAIDARPGLQASRSVRRERIRARTSRRRSRTLDSRKPS